MTKALWAGVWVALALGLAYRLYPVLVGSPALAEFFVTEDGYLMLTVARNMAIGLGMSVSEGTIATNGVQPLATFLFAAAFALFEGDRTAGLIGMHLITAAAALGSVFAFQRLALNAFEPLKINANWSWVAAALWFVGPLSLWHSMNGLETGLYTFVLLLTLLSFARLQQDSAVGSAGATLWFGGLCGAVFLARNDAVFLVITLFGTWALAGLIQHRLTLLQVVRRILPASVLCLLIIAPWLLNNQLRFGSIIPISGTAQSATAEFGQNAGLLPATLFEHMLPMLPIPGSLAETTAVSAVTLLTIVLILAWFFWRIFRAGDPMALVVFAYALHGFALCYYYGFNFGAPHFLSRYLAPLSPLLIMAAVVALVDLSKAIFRTAAQSVSQAVAIMALAMCMGILVLFAMPGQRVQGHFQVVGWVDENVSDETWVGAVQTGTLGFWHDRTINLDGKVNPEALAERLRGGTVLPYVVASEIDVLADWAGIAGWSTDKRGGFSEAFELIVDDPEDNLAVFRRRPE